jgi:hypothetical protein
MVRVGFLSGVLFLSLTSVIQAQQSRITYEAADLGSNTWQYDYIVSNITLAIPIEEFTVYFDEELYQNLAIIEPTPGGWDAIVWQPESGLGSGAFDAMATGLGIDMGGTAGGFSVKFDWLGTGSPAAQYYEIINPVDFTVIGSGYTVPEPSTCLFMLPGLVWLRSRLKSH